jgi:hypothetical protein
MSLILIALNAYHIYLIMYAFIHIISSKYHEIAIEHLSLKLFFCFFFFFFVLFLFFCGKLTDAVYAVLNI